MPGVCKLGTAGKGRCPMLTFPLHRIAILTAAVVLAGSPAAARGGGHGSPHLRAAVTATKTGSMPSSAAAVQIVEPVPQVQSTVLPPSALQSAAPAAAAIAPLSPPPAQDVLSGGGSSRTDLFASPTAASTSPSEAAPSRPGGGGETLRDCMKFWDRHTHMSKAEWRAACTRTLNRLDLRTPVP